MPKIIVTHIRPDLDACCSTWLIQTYLPNFFEADLKFVNAGETMDNQPADANPNILHVDTGMGKFDHHQLTTRTSAAERVLAYLLKEKRVKKEEIKALERLVELVTALDNFEECLWPEADADIYDLGISQILDGYKYVYSDDYLVMDFAQQILDALFKTFQLKIKAETDLKKGREFKIKHLKCLILETKRDSTARLAQLKGYDLVVYRNPDTGVVKIKARPDTEFNLKPVYEEIIKQDRPENWYYHEPSGKLLLNGSSKGPKQPTKLSLAEVVEIVTTVITHLV